jgi:hypothetical protein
MTKVSESTAETGARALLAVRGWKLARPPRGNVLRPHECTELAHLAGTSATGSLDLLVVTTAGCPRLVVRELANAEQVGAALDEVCAGCGAALLARSYPVLVAAVARTEQGEPVVEVRKWVRERWQPIRHQEQPIRWLPTPDEADLLLQEESVIELAPSLPPSEVLARQGEEINRLLREAALKDEYRPAVMGALVLALWHSRGQLRLDPAHILRDINAACRGAFLQAGQPELAARMVVPESNRKLAARAPRICHTLRLLNVTTLSGAHDYLGQLYELFFRFTGGNTIGQYFTPRHIARFIVELCAVGPTDRVVDPACGTGGFLLAALQRMLSSGQPTDQAERRTAEPLRGFESEPTTAALCVANLLLRGARTAGITLGDCFTDPDYPEGQATVVVGNPPFPHERTDQPAERFVQRGLDALRRRGLLGMVVPGSLLVSKGKWRDAILRQHTLRAAITLPPDLFQPYASSTTAVLLLEKGVPHGTKTLTFFCRITNDGYGLKKNVRVEQPGEQLSAALEAYRTKQSLPGFCTHARLSGADWSPGAYLQNPNLTEEAMKVEIEDLLRRQTAFHARFADRLHDLRQRLHRGEFQPVSRRALEPERPGEVPLASAGPEEEAAHDRIGRFFAIAYGQQELESKKHLKLGKLPVISSAGTDNGCYGFFDLAGIAPLIEPPFVTAPRTGSIGEAFVQLWPCAVTSDCLILTPREGTEEADLYIAAAAIRLERWRFDYSRKLTPGRVALLAMPWAVRLRPWLKPRLATVKRLIQALLAELPGA